MTKSGFRPTFEGNVATLSDGTEFEFPTTDQTSPTRALAVALRDAGKTNAEIGTLMGTTAGSAGNNVVNGLRDLGRDGEVTTNGTNTGGTKTAVQSPADAARDALERAREQAARVDEAVNKASDDAARFVDYLSAHKLDVPAELDDNTDPVIRTLARERDRLVKRAAEVSENADTKRAAADALVTQWEAAVTALEKIKA